MDHEPLSRDIMSALEACRPGRQDDELPEVAEILANASPVRVAAVRRSLQRVDRAITSATQQAPVPVGLAERLLDRLAAAERDREGLVAEGDAGAIRPCDDTAEKSERIAPLRAKWLAVGGALALAASLLVALALWPRETLQLAEMQAEVRSLYDADDHSAASGSTSLPSGADPTSLGGVSSEWVIGCHAIELLQRSGYAYELAHRRARGTLYVVPLKAWRSPVLSTVPKQGLGAVPVAQSTSGTTVVAWTDSTNAYFLVAKGDSISAFFPRSMA